MNSIWKKENETNENRALFIETCKKKSNLIFEGGFAARTNGDNLGFDKLVYSKKIPLNIYIEKIKNSAFVFNTPAVLSCHGWKLGEFLALGKAIITTHHYNELPADLENEKHVLYIRNEDELQKSIKKLMHDPTFKHSLELESRDYFEKYLAPQKVILRLLERS
ncbi:glycosyltransferase family 4 protein [Flavobacterium nitrogenifigens]|nr:glycosyltransferase family 4 protein [Flavobacterium nitrogenifigens]